MATAIERTIEIPTKSGDVVHGDLTVPEAVSGMVIFAHGSGSSRFSSRNRHVAEHLNDHSLGTLLMDLLTAAEDEVDQRTREHRFDIPLLGRRLVEAMDHLAGEDDVPPSPVGLFGASTGAAAALVAASERPDAVGAVVSRGGRPDLAGDALPSVTAPTLLLVGGLDHAVIGMNEDAATRLRAEHEIRIVEGASHLFEEPGTLDEVARHATDWFLDHLGH